MKLHFLTFAFLFFSCGTQGQNENKSINAKKVAVEGYDIVSYHVDQIASLGSSKFSVPIDDVYYYFNSAEHRDLFQKAPEKYLPKYGGFCAIGIALYDGKYDIDPEDFLIDDGELYLFCPGEIDNWKADQDNLKKLAELKWAEMELQQVSKKE